METESTKKKIFLDVCDDKDCFGYLKPQRMILFWPIKLYFSVVVTCAFCFRFTYNYDRIVLIATAAEKLLLLKNCTILINRKEIVPNNSQATMKCSTGLWLLSLVIVLGIVALTVQMLMARVHVSPRLAEELFRNFTKKFNKSYETPAEYQKRLNIFTVSFESIESVVVVGLNRNCVDLI